MNARLSVCALTVTLLSARAFAQHTSPYDMRLPADSVATCNGPLCMAYNPAGLRWSASDEIIYLHDERWNLDHQAAGGADGLMLATGLFGPLFDRLGLAVQYVRPDRDRERRDYLKYDLSATLLSVGDFFSLAGGIEILDPLETDEDPSVDASVGAMARPFRWLSFGAVGRNLAEAGIHGDSVHRSWDLGLAARPLWFAPERLTLAADYRFLEGANDPALRFTARASIIDGVDLLGTADVDGHFGFGLAIDFLRFGFGGYTGFSNRADVDNTGMVLYARASLQFRPGLSVLTGRTVEIVMDDELGLGYRPKPGLFRSRPTLWDVERAIRRAADDKRIDSLLIKVESVRLSFVQVQELRETIAAFKRTGKKVFFHLESADNAIYYLASIADAIYLNPAGRLAVTGPLVEALFIGGTLELIGVQAEADRVGKYKSATEALTRQEPSEAHREVMNSLADELADQMFTAIADGRGLARDQVEVLVDRGIMRPSQAEEAGLIDGVCHYDEIDGQLVRLLGHTPRRRADYMAERWVHDRWSSPPVVAVVHASGSIRQGRSRLPDSLDARRIAGILRSLRSSGSVEAVILRVDSPGGSGLASERIWREVLHLRKSKPVIVSMAGVAASGGYYISCPADWIVANPATITGSIGVYALLIDASELYARIGVSREAVGRGKLADLYSSFHGRSEEEHTLLKRMVDGFYRGFVDRVAEGRKMKREKIEAVAQGRVWTGRQAAERGLVDELGGLSRAIELAKERIGLPADDLVRVVHLPRQRLSLASLLEELGLVAVEQTPLPEMFLTPLTRLVALGSLSHEAVLAMLPLLSLKVR